MSAAPQPGITPEFAAAYREIMCEGLLNEFEITKKVLAAIPDARRDYRPDPKARTAWDLAWHIATEDVLFLEQIAEGKFSFPDPRYDKEKPNTVADLVVWYDKKFKRAVERLRAVTPGQLATPINFLGMFNLPGVFYLGFMNNHSVHHRGQLATYLRPMGSKVPSIYGGSADEPFQMPATA
jgi:uncharacterized damage-inducible protein DinB